MKKLLLFTITMIAQLGAMAQWTALPYLASGISCGSATQLAAIRGAGIISKYNFSTNIYDALSTSTNNFASVSICADGTLFGRSTNNLSASSNLVKYNTIPPILNGFTAVTKILDNNICALSSNFAVGSEGGSGLDNIHQWNGSTWSLLPGGASISARKVVVGGNSNNIYAMTWTGGNNVLAYNSGTWTAISNSTLTVSDISVGDVGKILAISGGKLYYRSGGAWVLDVTAPINLVQVSAASDGTVMILTSSGVVHRNTWDNIICGTTSLPPSNTTASQNLTICGGQTTTLTATGTGTLNWSGPSSGTGSTLITPTLTSTSTYSVTNTIGGCTSLSLITITVNVVPSPAFTGTTSSICSGNTASLTATGTPTISWYDNATSTTALGTGTLFITPTLTNNTTYYISSIANGCESPRVAKTVTVSPLPATPTDQTVNNGSSLNICVGQSTSLWANTNCLWYTVPSGGLATSQGIAYNTPSLSNNTTYYFESYSNGCSSATRLPITVTVSPMPSVLNQTVQNATCNGVSDGSIDLTFNNPSSYTYSWTPNVSTTYSASGLAAGVYTVKIENAGCVKTQTYTITQPAAYTTTVLYSNGTLYCPSYSGSPSFQWVDCNNSNAPILGEVGPFFTPTVTGSYALVFGYGSCTNMLACNSVTVTTTSLSENNLLNAITLQPNPASTYFTLNNVVKGTKINVMDITGKVVYSEKANTNNMLIETENLLNGLYIIGLENNGATTRKKLIISK